jgi:hypothetical protein
MHCYKDSGYNMTLIFVLTFGADTMTELFKATPLVLFFSQSLSTHFVFEYVSTFVSGLSHYLTKIDWLLTF